MAYAHRFAAARHGPPPVFMNHHIHHRAQLGVYLRLLNIPIPACTAPPPTISAEPPRVLQILLHAIMLQSGSRVTGESSPNCCSPCLRPVHRHGRPDFSFRNIVAHSSTKNPRCLARPVQQAAALHILRRDLSPPPSSPWCWPSSPPPCSRIASRPSAPHRRFLRPHRSGDFTAASSRMAATKSAKLPAPSTLPQPPRAVLPCPR